MLRLLPCLAMLKNPFKNSWIWNQSQNLFNYSSSKALSTCKLHKNLFLSYPSNGHTYRHSNVGENITSLKQAKKNKNSVHSIDLLHFWALSQKLVVRNAKAQNNITCNFIITISNASKEFVCKRFKFVGQNHFYWLYLW